MPNKPTYEYDLFISYAEADRAWVEGYLLDALITADIRYYSEATFTLGVPRLLEFERGVQQSGRTLLVLSPAYLAGGTQQFIDLMAQSYGLETATWRVIPIVLHSVDLPPHLEMLTRLDATNQADWEKVIGRLCNELQRPVPGPAPKPVCPYPGMVPFTAKDKSFFYGREVEINEIEQRLINQRYFWIIGPSGSGKSSLVQAGVLARLAESSYFSPGFWLVRRLRPGSRPIKALAVAIGSETADMAEAITDLLADNPPAQRFLLFIDQFEELFTHADEAEQTLFIKLIQDLKVLANCALLIAMRADFYPDLMNSELWPVDQRQRLEIVPLRGEELSQAIGRPANKVGVFLEPRLLEKLLGDAAEEPGVLPLLQETMRLLWGKMERRLLTLETYQKLGKEGRSGLAVAIANKADGTLNELNLEQHAMARRLFLRLIQFGEGRADTRRQQTVAQLDPGGKSELFPQTLEVLVTNRLLTLTSEVQGQEKKVDISHEALITGWPTLQSWIGERRDQEKTRRRLEEKAKEWKEWIRLGKSGGLLDEAELVEAEQWLQSPDAADLGYSEDLRELARNSRQVITKQRKRKRNSQIFAWCLTGITGVAAIIVFLLFLQAEQQRKVALARQLAAQSRSLFESSYDLALLLGLKANQVTEEPLKPRNILNLFKKVMLPENYNIVEPKQALFNTLTLPPYRIRFFHQTNSVFNFSANGDKFLFLDGERDLVVYNLTNDQQIRVPLIGIDLSLKVTNISLSSEGNILALESDVDFKSPELKNVITFWEVKEGKLREPVIDLIHSAIAINPNGKIFALKKAENDHIEIWDFNNLNLLYSLKIQDQSLKQLQIDSMLFSQDGESLLLWYRKDSFSKCIRFDLPNRSAMNLNLPAKFSDINGEMATALSPNGKSLVLSEPPKITFYSMPLGNMSDQISMRDNCDVQFKFSQNGKYLAIYESEHYVRHPDTPIEQKNFLILYDIQQKREVSRVYVTYLQRIEFIKDGKILVASGSSKGFSGLFLWDVPTLQPLNPPLSHKDINSFTFSLDGEYIASSDMIGNIILWRISGNSLGKVLVQKSKRVDSLVFSPNSQKLALAENNSLKVWDVINSPPKNITLNFGEDKKTREIYLKDEFKEVTIKKLSYFQSLAFSPNGEVLAIADSLNDMYVYDLRKGIQIGDTISANDDFSREKNITKNIILAFTPEGQVLAATAYYITQNLGLGTEQKISLWNLSREKFLGELPGHKEMVSCMAFSPDGSLLASGDEAALYLWDLSTRTKKQLTLNGGPHWLRCLALSSNGKKLACASDMDIILADIVRKSQDAPSLSQNKTLLGKDMGILTPLRAVCFSPDGNILAAANDEGIFLWDLNTYMPIGSIIEDVYNPEKSKIISDERRIGERIYLSFSPNGKLLVFSNEKKVILYDADIQSWKNRARNIVNRDLTSEEREMYFGR